MKSQIFYCTYLIATLFILSVVCDEPQIEQKASLKPPTQLGLSSHERSQRIPYTSRGTFQVYHQMTNNNNSLHVNNARQPVVKHTLGNNNRDNFPKNHRQDEIPNIQNESYKKNKTSIYRNTPVEKFNINIDDDDDDYKPNHHLANKHKNMRTILINVLKKNENNKNFAAVLPILKVMSPAQRVAMASLVTSQISNGARGSGLKLAQVNSMFGNNTNATADLMLPIILDIANLFKSLKDYKKRRAEKLPNPELLKRSFPDDDNINVFDVSTLLKSIPARSLRRMDVMDEDEDDEQIGVISNVTKSYENQAVNASTSKIEGASLNTTSTEGLPVAEELRYMIRNGQRPIRKPVMIGQRLPPSYPIRRASSELRRKPIVVEQKKISKEPASCNLFTESLCLDAYDYPMQAITSSIRKNLNVMNALHSDFPELSGDSALDGVSKLQEEKYTPEHYLNNINRREDGDIKSGDASGFMCPSVVKYARPQKARATSGQWKYIVNTVEHTQTLRLEKCLKPMESCTFLTDNFRSKCIQVYNYHRLLTWDQQNGLHMDIFKVPTCCSCHIDGYSFAYPPVDEKPLEITQEYFPGEELVHEGDRNRFVYSKPTRQTVNKETILKAFNNANKDEYLQHDFTKNTRHPTLNQYSNTKFYDDVYPQDSKIHQSVKKPQRDPADFGTDLPSFLEPPSKPNLQQKTKTQGAVYVKRGQVGNQGNNLKRPVVVRKPIRKKISELANDYDQDIDGSDNYETQTRIYSGTIPLNSHSKVPIIVRSPKDEISSSSEKSVTLQGVTTEGRHIKNHAVDHDNNSKGISLNRRVNYNYHPIIDFFEERNNKKNSHVASDRIDSSTDVTFDDQKESDWRPMTAPLA